MRMRCDNEMQWDVWDAALAKVLGASRVGRPGGEVAGLALVQLQWSRAKRWMACRRTQPSNCSREAKCTLHTTLTAHKVQATAQTVQCRRTQPSNCSRTACKAECTLPALHSLHAKYKLYNVGGLNPHSSNCTLQLLAMHSKYSVQCIRHGVVHYTMHNGHCTMPSDAVLSCTSACSQHHVGNMTACKHWTAFNALQRAYTNKCM